ncbi:Response regulator receiver domain-containing protein [Halomicrobium zhouii]|uniref:Response regulator receiver domain-containing protein n=1 Tax=Halomicrobium zhouii TaxID=767519 RepID=A0A1I6LZG5_9EURY|nr:response regulator [Halomicrobium zhouii]MCU4799045.1 response regulator [Halobacteria archaeon HArc-gm2]SFS08805.1 Response regulator receiver domain-containing protein [Halomicrobium zhouii]
MTTQSGRPENLLVVEDNPGDSRLIEEGFREANSEATLHVVSTGEEALDFVHLRGEYEAAPEPDLILLDWNLPAMDGERLLSELQAAYEDVPVAIMTGSQATEAAIRSVAPDADAYLTKPTEPTAYVDLVRSIY